MRMSRWRKRILALGLTGALAGLGGMAIARAAGPGVVLGVQPASAVLAAPGPQQPAGPSTAQPDEHPEAADSQEPPETANDADGPGGHADGSAQVDHQFQGSE